MGDLLSFFPEMGQTRTNYASNSLLSIEIWEQMGTEEEKARAASRTDLRKLASRERTTIFRGLGEWSSRDTASWA
jgi:hypothetical protein